MAGPAVTSAFGNKPGNLPDPSMQPAPAPVPDIGGVGNIMQGQTSVGQMVPPAPASAAPEEVAAAPESADDLFAQLDEVDAAAPDAEVSEGEPGSAGMSTAPVPEGWESAKEQIREASARLKNAFAVTGKESVGVLKNSGLFEDVRYVGNKLQVKRKGRGGWENFDRDKIELLGDTLDFARDGVEAIVENSFRVAATAVGTAGGAAAGAPTGPGAIATAAAGGRAAMAAGGAGGAVVAKNAGDVVAQMMGVQRDPERSHVKENAMAAAFGAGFTLIGSSLARRAAARAAARNEAQKTIEHATKNAAETVADIAEVQKSGIVLGKDGKFKLDPQQSVGAGEIPELDATAKELSTEQSFRNFRRQVGDSIQSAYDGIARALGAQAGKGANLADDFVLTAKDVRSVEGKMIGAFRDQVDSQLKGVAQPTPRTLQTMQFVKQSIKSERHAERQLGLMPAQAKQYMREVNLLTGLLARTKGQMRIDTMFALEKRLTQQINSNINSPNGRQLGIALMDLRNAVKDDGIDMMENAFRQMGDGKGELLNKFIASKTRYRELMKATDGLGKMLDTENISKNEMISKLFEGKGSYKFAMNAKTLINETNPRMWDNMAGEYFLKLRNDATDPLTNSVNWGQVSKKWSNLDPRLQQELLNTTGIPKAGMDALLRLGTKVQGASFPAMAKDPQMKVTKGLIKNAFIFLGSVTGIGGSGATAKGTAVGNLLDGMGKDQALMKWMKDGGLEEILKEMPGMKPSKRDALREFVVNWVPRPVRTSTSQGAQTSIRNRSIEAASDTPGEFVEDEE